MADMDEDAPLVALAPLAALARPRNKAPRVNHRPRWVPSEECEALRDVIIGFVEDDHADDPAQFGKVQSRQSKEVTALAKEHSLESVPIAKSQRGEYVWVARAQVTRRDTCKMYTWNVEKMLSHGKYEEDDDNRCDVCGIACTEVLYEFRCYRRCQNVLGMQAENLKRRGARRLDPFISYISLECGRSLLGVRTQASQFLEHLTDVINSANATEQLQELWASATEAQKRHIEAKLRYLARSDLGESERGAELKRAERLYGELVPKGEDAFRVVSRALSPSISAWELAAATVHRADAGGLLPEDGFLSEVAHRFKEKQPLPTVSSTYKKPDAIQVLQLMSKLWPLRLELNDMLTNPMAFAPESGEAVASIRLVYTCMELHAIASVKVEPQSVKLLKTYMDADLKECRTKYDAREAGVPRTSPKREDMRIEAPPAGVMVPSDMVCDALENITWKPCMSRKNVMPNGVNFISAFPMGLVLNYCSGLMCSVTLRIWPNLARLVTRYLHQEFPDFQYTTIQFNRDYATKMHVDANNLGPSYITALGDFEGGELWIMDPKGDVEMEVTDPLRGYNNLPIGSKVLGKVHNVRNKWLDFNGTVPHATLPFKGRRISLVYFTRNKFNTMQDTARKQLEAAGFNLPDEQFVQAAQAQRCTFTAVFAQDGKRHKVTVQPPPPVREEIDEVDEEEQFDSSLREELQGPRWHAHDWARQLMGRLGVAWGAASLGGRPLGVSCCCAGLTPVLALQEVLPGAGQVRVLAISDPSLLAIEFSKKNSSPEHAFQDVTSVPSGKGLCEVEHKVCAVAPPSDEDLFVGGFCCGPFLNRNLHRSKHTCFNDPNAAPFKQQRLHIVKRCPPIAVLWVLDYEELPPLQRTDALHFVMAGTDQRDGTKWGLGFIDNYWCDICEVVYGQYGVPLAQRAAVVLLIRKDCGGQNSVEEAITLLRETLGKALGTSTVNELLFEDDDGRVAAAQREWQRCAHAADTGTSKAAYRSMAQRVLKSMGLKAGDLTYAASMKEAKGAGFVEKQWFPHAADGQKTCMNLVYERAKQIGMDTANLVVQLDPRQLLKEQAWLDDGHLPSMSARAGHQAQYSFSKHRPITGHEQLLCRGYPLARVRLQRYSDQDLGQIAAASIPVPVMGAVLCSVIAAADLKGRAFRLPKSTLAKVMGGDLQTRAISAASIAEAATKEKASTESSEEAQFEGKAAALLTLVKHGSFQQQEHPGSKKATEQTTKALSSLEKVVDEEGDLKASVDDPTDPLHRKSPPADDPRDWSIRLRKLRYANPPPEMDAILRWVWDAVDDSRAAPAEDIVSLGLELVRKSLKSGKPLTRACKSVHDELDQGIKAAGFADKAGDLFDVMRALTFEESLRLKDPAKAVQAQTPASMAAYVSNVVEPLESWPMQRTFIEHVIKEFQAANRAALVSAFAEHGGFLQVSNFLFGAPDKLEETWPKAPDDLEVLRRYHSGACARLLPAIHSAAQKGTKAKKAAERVEQQMVEETIRALQLSAKVALQKLKQFEHAHGSLGLRFQCTMEMVECAMQVYEDQERFPPPEEGPLSQHWRKVDDDFMVKIQSVQRRITQEGDVWEHLSKAENDFVKRVRDNLATKAKEARSREADEAQRKTLEEERKRLRDMKEREELRAAQERMRVDVVLQEGEHWERQVLSLLSGGCLIERDQGGILTLHTQLKGLKKIMDDLPPDARARFQMTMNKAIAAARMVAEAPERHAQSVEWLERHGLEACVEMLEAQGLVDRLCELGTKGDELLRHTCLPSRLHQKLIRAAGNIIDDPFTPAINSSPIGWTRETSSSGLGYFKRQAAPHETQWLWPLPPKRPKTPDQSRLSEPLEPASRGQPGCDVAVYIETKGDGGFYCSLCEQACPDISAHLRNASHRRAVQQWGLLTGALDRCRVLLSKATQNSSDEVKGLVACWREELRWCIEDAKSGADCPPPLPVDATFWHRVVIPLLPSTSSASNIGAAFGAMLEIARLPEPSPRTRVPKPGVDFPYFPPTSEELVTVAADVTEEELKLLTPYQLLTEGLKKKSSGGGYWCGYCEEDVDDLMRHLHPYYKKTADRHRKNRDMTQTFISDLRVHGCKLQAAGAVVSNFRFSCVCGKSGEWWKLFEDESGHLASRAHQAVAGRGVPVPTAVEQAAWDEVFDVMDIEFNAQKASDAIAARARKLSAEEQRTKRLEEEETKRKQQQEQKQQQETKAAAAAAAEAEESARARAESLPPLPKPGKDFPWVREGDDGLIPRGEQWFCSYCEFEVSRAERENHLSLETKIGKQHAKNFQYTLSALAVLRKDGWKLPREGIELKDREFHCRCCETTGRWYELCATPPHIETKRHMKCRRGLLGDPPPDSSNDPMKSRWAQMLSLLDRGGSVAVGSTSPDDEEPMRPAKRAKVADPEPLPEPVSPFSPPDLPEQPVKRPRTEAASSSSPLDEVAAAPEELKLPAGAVGYPFDPTEADIADAKKRAESRWVPKLPHDNLFWAYFRKPHLYMACRVCKAWISIVEFNTSTGVMKTDDGSCPHYGAAARQRFHEGMKDVLAGKW